MVAAVHGVLGLLKTIEFFEPEAQARSQLPDQVRAGVITGVIGRVVRPRRIVQVHAAYSPTAFLTGQLVSIHFWTIVSPVCQPPPSER